MRPFREGVSLLQEDLSVMDDAVLPILPPQLPAEQPCLRASVGWASQLLLVTGTWDPQGTEPTGDPFPPPMEPLSLHKRWAQRPQAPSSAAHRETLHPDAMRRGGSTSCPHPGLVSQNISGKAHHGLGGLPLGAAETLRAPLGCHPSLVGTPWHVHRSTCGWVPPRHPLPREG